MSRGTSARNAVKADRTISSRVMALASAPSMVTLSRVLAAPKRTVAFYEERAADVLRNVELGYASDVLSEAERGELQRTATAATVQPLFTPSLGTHPQRIASSARMIGQVSVIPARGQH